MPPVQLLSVATAAPPHVLDQDEAARLAVGVFGGKVFREADLLALFRNTGIHTRRTALPLEWYLRPQDWAARNAAYLDAAEALYEAAAREALDRAGVTAGEVGTVVTVSSTGIATPSLEARLHGRLGLDARVVRAPLFGLGCAGGVSGLAVARRLAAADPDGRPVLFVAVELCSLAVRTDEATKANAVASALFGDGAAALVLRAGEPRPGDRAVVADRQHLWPDTLDVMGWTVDPSGFGIVLAATLPAFVAQRFGEAVEGFDDATGGPPARHVCHPGGARVLPALEGVLGLAEGALDVERDVLRDFGNMSAPTVHFVLERVLADGPAGPLTLAALGPGFTASLVALGGAGVTGAILLLAFVTLQRGAELVYARGNEARLRAAGAVEVGAAHYPAIVALHATWLLVLWVAGWDRPLQPAWTALYLLLQLGRAWVLATLGRRWSTRVFVVPGETLVARGPFRFVRHPNYLVVACEIFVLPLALGLPWLALLFGSVNLAVLAWRIRVEGRALAELATRPA